MDGVLSVIVVSDVTDNLFLEFVVGSNADLEFIATGLAVLAVVISSLDEEFDIFVDGHVLHETASETERGDGSGVKEEAEIAPRGG
jgi:hypothetical protein